MSRVGRIFGRAKACGEQVEQRLGELYEDARVALDPELRRRRAAARRVQIGCGAENQLAGWYNVDILPFPGVDEVLDVQKRWPFRDLELVFCEHFLEHLALDQALLLLERIGRSLLPSGVLRVSTPNLHWVWLTHFATAAASPEERVKQTLDANRAFHGWGHRFLWSKELLEWVLSGMGWSERRWCNYGESSDARLIGLERHGGYEVGDGQPSVLIVEAVRGNREIVLPSWVRERAEHDFMRHVRAGY